MSSRQGTKSQLLDDLLAKRKGGGRSARTAPDAAQVASVEPPEVLTDPSLFEQVFEYTPFGMMLVTIKRDRYGHPEGFEILRMNTRYAALVGLKRADLLKRRFFDAIPGGRADWESLATIVAAKSGEQSAICYFEETDRYLDVVIFKPRKDILGVWISDARAKYEASSTLGRKEIESRDTIDACPAMLCRFSPEGRLEYANDLYHAFVDEVPELLVGHCFVPTIPREERDGVLGMLSSLTRAHHSVTYEHSIVVNGSVRWGQWTDRARFDEKGALVGYLSVGHDITERRRNDASVVERMGYIQDLIVLRKEKEQESSARLEGSAKQLGELQNEMTALRERLRDVTKKTVQGAVTVCSGCGRVHDDEGHWMRSEMYMRSHTLASVTDGTCPYCRKK